MNKPKDDTTPAKANPPREPAAAATASRKCGLVMPISAMDGILASHWQDVKAIVTEALPEWTVSLVSEGEDAVVIQRRIVERLYTDEMVVVDVSARNPNVMFELGMRLAFDKPTVIIKDEPTQYPFDVAPNEYVEYPRDLHFHKIVEFKKRLAAKVAATAKPGHQTYLRSFGPFKVARFETEEVSPDQLILERLGRMETLLARTAAREVPGSGQIFTTGPFVGAPVVPGWKADVDLSLARNKAQEITKRMLAVGVARHNIDDAVLRFLKEYGFSFDGVDVETWCIREGYVT